MPDWKSELGNERIPQKVWLEMPAIGMESEFNVYLDGVEIIPEVYWTHPSAFISAPMLHRTGKSSQIPTGGAVYFDRGVIEVVTPVIEIAPGCTARVVRNLWEQIEFVRGQLTEWEQRTGHHVRLKAYSSHYNISYEIPKREQSAARNEKKLALLLAYVLAVPIAVVGTNRRSTGVGVRPRGHRIEITADFTPDPGLMIATATLVVGIVREMMTWPSYELSMLDELPIPVVEGVIPGKHTTRKGWLTKDFHFPRSPFTANIDDEIWPTRDGRVMSLRQIAREVAWFFRRSIRRLSDPFSFRLLFAILEGRAPSMLELLDRPTAYEDVGRLCRWGDVIHELKSFQRELEVMFAREALFDGGTIGQFIEEREREKSRFLAAESDTVHHGQSSELREADAEATQKVLPNTTSVRAPEPPPPPAAQRRRVSAYAAAAPQPGRKSARRRSDTTRILPVRTDTYLDRRAATARELERERRRRARRLHNYTIPFPDRRLTRSAYEQVFLKLVSGQRLRIGTDSYTPVGMKGWYHAILRRDSDGRERLLTIDQLLKKMSDWQ